MTQAWSDTELPLTITAPHNHHPMKLLFSKYFSKVSTRKNWTSLWAEFNSHTPDSQHTSILHVGCVQSKRHTHTHTHTHTRTNFSTKRRWLEEITNFDNYKSILKIEKNTYANVRNILHGHSPPNVFQGGVTEQVACSENLPHALINFI